MRFAAFWNWTYRFEAYTPAAKRKFGYYALPLLWSDQVVGWVNAASEGGTLSVAVAFAGKRPREAAFRRELEAEADRLRDFVGATRVAIRTDAG